MLSRNPSAVSPRPQVWFFNRSYWPDTEASGQLLAQLCEDLASDLEITVFCGQPNHVDTEVTSEVTLESYSGRHHGVRIRRVPHTRFPKSSLPGRLVNLASFTLMAFFVTLFRRRPRIVVTQTDPFFLPLLGWWLRLRYRCRFVACLQDVYPDIAVALGRIRNGLATRLLRSLLVGACNRADAVIVVSEGMRERCVRNGIKPDRISVVHNWADCRLIAPRRTGNPIRARQGWGDKLVVMYSGNLGLSHELTSIVEAACLLRDAPEIQLVFVGEGVQKPELVRRVQSEQLSNVTFLPYQPRSLLSDSLSAADVHLVTLRPGTEGCVMPSKLYGILAAGCPVLAVSPDGDDTSRFVQDNQVGVHCPASDDSAATGRQLAAILRAMSADRRELARMARRAREIALTRFDRPHQVAAYSTILHRLLRAIGSDHVSSRTACTSSVKPQPWELVPAVQSQRDTADDIHNTDTIELQPVSSSSEYSSPASPLR